MQREVVRQRIRYLVEHGGLHEQEGLTHWQRAIFWMLAANVALQLVLLLR